MEHFRKKYVVSATFVAANYLLPEIVESEVEELSVVSFVERSTHACLTKSSVNAFSWGHGTARHV